MNPSNPSNGNAPIYKFKDSNNVERQVVPLNHTHSISEVTELQVILAALQAAVNNGVTWKTSEQVDIGSSGYNRHFNGAFRNLANYDDYFLYQQIRLKPVGGEEIYYYGAIKLKINDMQHPYYCETDIDFDGAVGSAHTSIFDLQVLQ